jgi:hypothetical protein
LIPVPSIDLKFLNELAAGDAGSRASTSASQACGSGLG